MAFFQQTVVRVYYILHLFFHPVNFFDLPCYDSELRKRHILMLWLTCLMLFDVVDIRFYVKTK